MPAYMRKWEAVVVLTVNYEVRRLPLGYILHWVPLIVNRPCRQLPRYPCKFGLGKPKLLRGVVAQDSIKDAVVGHERFEERCLALNPIDLVMRNEARGEDAP